VNAVHVFVDCTSGGPASDPGRLSSSDVIVHVTVLASNNPYGVYMFANGSRHFSIAEDSSDLSADAADTAAVLLVEKTSGAADYVQVLLPLLLLLVNCDSCSFFATFK